MYLCGVCHAGWIVVSPFKFSYLLYCWERPLRAHPNSEYGRSHLGQTSREHQTCSVSPMHRGGCPGPLAGAPMPVPAPSAHRRGGRDPQGTRSPAGAGAVACGPWVPSTPGCTHDAGPTSWPCGPRRAPALHFPRNDSDGCLGFEIVTVSVRNHVWILFHFYTNLVNAALDLLLPKPPHN